MHKRLACFTACLGLIASGSVMGDDITQLEWLNGCWAAQDAEAGSIEYWSAPAGGLMLGASKTVKNGKAVAFEFLQIRVLDTGKLAFIAKPSGQAEATFALASLSANEFAFENPQHDFPQRVSYRLVRAGELLARIEGTLDGKRRAIDYPMRKVACEKSG